MYAIIETGGKQYKVSPGESLEVGRLDAAEGKTVEIDRVLLIADGGKITPGNPVVDGARVFATSQGDSRSDKIVVFKYKAKVRYQKKTGNRQLYTRLVIDKILEPGIAEEKPAPKPRRKKKEVTADGA